MRLTLGICAEFSVYTECRSKEKDRVMELMIGLSFGAIEYGLGQQMQFQSMIANAMIVL